MSNLVLPRVFEISKDNPNYEKYKHHIGKPKLSYSQVGSWLNSKYKQDYIKQYFGEVKLPGGIYADFGTAVGEYIEYKGMYNKINRGILSNSDIEIIEDNVDFPENCIYEDMIVVEINDNLVMEGYIDRAHYDGKKVTIRDYKTGSIKNKAAFYESDEYLQTMLYAYQKKKEGYEVEHCEVFMLDRAGNGREGHPLRLTGDCKYICRKYNEKLVKKYLKNVKKTAEEISELYNSYIKFLK